MRRPDRDGLAAQATLIIASIELVWFHFYLFDPSLLQCMRKWRRLVNNRELVAQLKVSGIADLQ